MNGRILDRKSRRNLVTGLEHVYAVCGGPVSWLAQINLVYPLVATPCFAGPQRNLSFPPDAHWAFIAALVIDLALLVAAAASGLLSGRIFTRSGGADERSREHFERAGVGRLQFLTYWGMLLGFGFSVLILLNAIAFIMVPPCAI